MFEKVLEWTAKLLVNSPETRKISKSITKRLLKPLEVIPGHGWIFLNNRLPAIRREVPRTRAARIARAGMIVIGVAAFLVLAFVDMAIDAGEHPANVLLLLIVELPLLMWARLSPRNFLAFPAALLFMLAGLGFLGVGVWLTTLPWLGRGSGVKYFFAAISWLLASSFLIAGGATLWERLGRRERTRRKHNRT